MKPSTLLLMFSLAGAALLPTAAQAVCLDPGMKVSGYRIPLDEEIRTSPSILIGRVINSQELMEDPTDPQGGVTARIYTVRVQRRLKGPSASFVSIKIENTSSRYPIEVGEQHLLFLTLQRGTSSFVDVCGNSSALPGGTAVAKQVEAKLQKAVKPR